MNTESGIYDPLIETEASGNGSESPTDKPPRFIEFFSPSQLRAYKEPEGHKLVGDYIIQRGGISILLGAPGVGKSRAALWLAVKGALGRGCWFGLKVHTRFKTLIIQNENGLPRLSRDICGMNLPVEADENICISSPPVLGMQFADPNFRAELRSIIELFQPDLVIIDPWNAVCRDSMERDFQEGLHNIRDVLSAAEKPPAALIVHHLRKPRAEDRARGRSLVHLGAGSYTLNSTARATLIIQGASDDVDDRRVVFNVGKCSDSAEAWPKRTCWEMDSQGFEASLDFDFEAFDNGGAVREPIVKLEHLQEVFRGEAFLPRNKAAALLEEVAKCGRTTAYGALKTEGGRFSQVLGEEHGMLVFKSEEKES